MILIHGRDTSSGFAKLAALERQGRAGQAAATIGTVKMTLAVCTAKPPVNAQSGSGQGRVLGYIGSCGTDIWIRILKYESPDSSHLSSGNSSVLALMYF